MFDFIRRPFLRRYGRDSVYYRIIDDVFGICPDNIELYKLALVHKSASLFLDDGRQINNERLEFLGDSVLSIVVSQYLFENYRNLPEGELTKLRASLVCEKTLFGFAQQIELGEFILLGKGEENSGGRERPSILADAFEAVIAAIYLDGGLEAARKHILSFIPKNLDVKKKLTFNDYKTMLQEIIQQNPDEKVEYVLTEQSGPDHNKAFVVDVMLNSNVIGKGKGRSKKQAEQMAAKEALELMGYET